MTKIDVISGFLGAGKTTFIKKLLEEAIAGEQVVLIENEFGEIGIDGGFLKDAGIEIREMNSGCICCSLVGDFGKSLQEVITRYQPQRVIIEPSGVGKLSDVMKAVRDVSADLDVTLNSSVTVVDVKKCRMYMKNFGEFFNNQIQYAGNIVLSRTDIADHDKVEAAVAMIRELNDKASIITTPLDQLTGAQLLEIIEKPDTMMEDLMAEVRSSIMSIITITTMTIMITSTARSAAAMTMSTTIIMTTSMTRSAAAMTMSIITIMTTSMARSAAAMIMSIIMTMTMITARSAAATIMSITTMTTSTAKAAAAAVMTMITTITTQMRYSPAGEWRLRLPLSGKIWKPFWKIWQRPPITAKCCGQRACFRRTKRESGCTLTWFRSSMRSGKASRITPERCVSSVPVLRKRN